MNANQIAKDVIQSVGGKDNILSAMHCATRLRLRLKDYGKVDEKALSDVDQVKGVFLANDQYQIIFGSGTVNQVTDEVLKETGLGSAAPADHEPKEKQGSWLSRAVKVLSDIFVPIIPAIVAGGLLMGINNVLTASGLFFPGQSLIDAMPQFAGIAAFINMCASAPFTFLPVLIGFSATKKFGGNPYLGAAMGMVMVHPDLLNAYAVAGAESIPTWNWFGLEVQAIGYQGTVLPVLAVSWILATIEKKLHKITPSWLDNLSTRWFRCWLPLSSPSFWSDRRCALSATGSPMDFPGCTTRLDSLAARSSVCSTHRLRSPACITRLPRLKRS